ncbi:MAG: response regulator [Pseudomonadota bacterium]
MDEIDELIDDRAKLEKLVDEHARLKEQVVELKNQSGLAEGNSERTADLIYELADVSRQGVIILGEKNIEFCNERARELNGVPESVLDVGKPWLDFFLFQMERGDFGEGEEAQEFFDALIANFERRKIMQIERKAGNGRIIRADRIPNSIGGMTLTLTDITELKEREAQLEESIKMAESAERAKSEFLANMSHEIRTPMNGVMGMAELLADTELDAKQKMFTDVIVKSGASLLTIINDILDFSKIDAGQMELDPVPFQLAEAIEDVATLISAKVAEKDLELIVRIDPALPKMLVGDVGRIRQIVTNLLGNAVKFTEKGHVYVNVEGQIVQNEAGNFADLKFLVEDTGIGIPESQRDQIFVKFNQADTSATRKHEGTGLGLSIASSLIGLMNGELGVDSKVGQGSTFWFKLHLPVHGETAPKQVIPGDISGARILIIDDNMVNRSILTEQMTAWNFDGAAAKSGAEGLHVMKEVLENGMNLDLVILDYQMPEMSGAEVLRNMRDDVTLRSIPVLMLTSVDSSETNQQLAKLGIEAHLTKPARSSLLLETILQVIANNRADVKTKSSVVNRPSHLGVNKSEQAPQILQMSSMPDDQLDILLAEDNEVNQIVFRQILEETGLGFKMVENGRLAFATYKVQTPRMILMDVSMPEMNGKEATIAIRKYERENKKPRTPIVGVTAHAMKGDMEACLDAGMDDYLSKPVSPKKLKLKIQQWLKAEARQEVVAKATVT